jgi:hypothetical protein
MKASQGERIMLNDFEEVNRILAEMVDEGMVEPIDDPNVEVNFWDWADIVGVVDEYVPVEYTT